MELNFEYFVVEFIHQPYDNIEKYVCVPNSWVKANVYGPTDRRVAVMYAAKPWPEMDKLVKTKQSPSKEWRSYRASLIFGSDNFIVVKTYIYKKLKCEEMRSIRKKEKINKIKPNHSETVARVSLQNIHSVSERRKIKKELKNSKQRSKDDIICNLTRSTVIKSTKSVNKSHYLHKNTGKHNMPLVKDKVEENDKKGYPLSNKQNNKISKSSDEKLGQDKEECLDDDIILCDVIISYDESIKHSSKEMSHLLNHEVKNDSSLLDNSQNSVQQTNTSVNTVTVLSNASDMTEQKNCSHNVRSIVPICTHTTRMSSQIPDETKSKQLLIADEPFEFQNPEEKSITIIKSAGIKQPQNMTNLEILATDHSRKDNRAPESDENIKSSNHLNYVVDDPRNVIITKVIKIKLSQAEEKGENGREFVSKHTENHKTSSQNALNQIQLSKIKTNENKLQVTNEQLVNNFNARNVNVTITPIETNMVDKTKVFKQFNKLQRINKKKLNYDQCNKINVSSNVKAKQKTNKLLKFRTEKKVKTKRNATIALKDNDKDFNSMPPEYNPDDSRWTLKHQKNSPGLVELIPGSHVYIYQNKLLDCVNNVWCYNILARKLLIEIYTLNAIRVCSLTGVRKGLGHKVELDVTAKSALLKFVEDFGRSKGWPPMDTASVLSSVRYKIHEIRKKITCFEYD